MTHSVSDSVEVTTRYNGQKETKETAWGVNDQCGDKFGLIVSTVPQVPPQRSNTNFMKKRLPEVQESSGKGSDALLDSIRQQPFNVVNTIAASFMFHCIKLQIEVQRDIRTLRAHSQPRQKSKSSLCFTNTSITVPDTVQQIAHVF